MVDALCWYWICLVVEILDAEYDSGPRRCYLGCLLARGDFLFE
jgi:hypothetical protein